MGEKTESEMIQKKLVRGGIPLHGAEKKVGERREKRIALIARTFERGDGLCSVVERKRVERPYWNIIVKRIEMAFELPLLGWNRSPRPENPRADGASGLIR